MGCRNPWRNLWHASPAVEFDSFKTQVQASPIWFTGFVDTGNSIHVQYIQSESIRLRHFTIRLDLHVTSQLDSHGVASHKSTSGMTNRHHFQPTLHSLPKVKIREITIHEPSSFLKHGHKLQSIRVDSIESTTFSTHRQSPDQLYFLSLARIDFRHVESTEGETIRVDAIPVCRIANTKDESTLVGYIGQPSWYTAKSINQLL